MMKKLLLRARKLILGNKATVQKQKNIGTAFMAKSIKLVKGAFEPADAADVILSLINDKIKFHTIQSLNLKKGSTEDQERSEQRITELTKAKKMVTELVVIARDQGFEIEIDSNIEITLKNNKNRTKPLNGSTFIN
ncbi:hypothetical protein [Spongiimicrobium sp. 3-5]|uniref:hypothetical protein n=1 Tax=Spongiimicrobium sp. 3-5 TaxID=3332596 RepID=UPI00397FA02A